MTAVSIKNNNPANIKKGGKTDWRGTVGYDQYGHAIFDTMYNGIRASLVDMKNKYKRDINTITELTAKWAEANKAAYAKFVEERTGINRDSVYKLSDLRKIAPAMYRFETGYDISNLIAKDFELAWKEVFEGTQPPSKPQKKSPEKSKDGKSKSLGYFVALFFLMLGITILRR